MTDSERPGGPLRVLFTNNTMVFRAGSENYVRDLALGLLRRGHLPVVYSPLLGDFADELRQKTVPVIEDLEQLRTPPDIIHGHHHHETMTAVMQFPRTPAIYVCHGWLPWQAIPPAFPTIQRYVAVDDLCKERLLTTGRIPEDRISMIYNFVDLDRFAKVRVLPERPGSAMVFSNYARGIPDAIRAACHAAGIERVESLGGGSGNAVADPERIIPQFDIVFAKARSAIEAMASGSAVIVTDYAKLAGMVTPDNFDRLRRLNFGVRALQAGNLTETALAREIARYDRDAAKAISDRVRAEAGLEKAVDTWIAIYRDAIVEHSGTQSAIPDDARLNAASRYLRFLAPYLKKLDASITRADNCKAKLESAEAASAASQKRVDTLRKQLEELTAENARLAAELARQQAAHKALSRSEAIDELLAKLGQTVHAGFAEQADGLRALSATLGALPEATVQRLAECRTEDEGEIVRLRHANNMLGRVRDWLSRGHTQK